MPLHYLEVVDPQSRLAKWAWSPVIVLRVSLVLTYLLFAYGSVVAFRAGVPVIDLTTPTGYRAFWATGLFLASLTAAIGSISDRWQVTERWATLGMTALLAAYVVPMNVIAYGGEDLNRQFVSVVAVIACVLPVGRFVYLAAQSGKSKHVPQSAVASPVLR